MTKHLSNDLVTKVQAALIAGCHPATIDRRIKAGLLRAELRFGRWMIRGEDLDAFMEQERERGRVAFEKGQVE